MSELKPESKKLHEAINKAMKSDDFYDTILEAAQAKQIDQLQKKLTDRDLLLTKEHKRCKELKIENTELNGIAINLREKLTASLDMNRRLLAQIENARK